MRGAGSKLARLESALESAEINLDNMFAEVERLRGVLSHLVNHCEQVRVLPNALFGDTGGPSGVRGGYR